MNIWSHWCVDERVRYVSESKRDRGKTNRERERECVLNVAQNSCAVTDLKDTFSVQHKARSFH